MNNGNHGNHGLIHDLLQFLMSSVQWTRFINGTTSLCECYRWLKRVITQIFVCAQHKAGWRYALSHLTADKHTAAGQQTETSFKRDRWSQERSSTHHEDLCVQSLQRLWKIHRCSTKLQKWSINRKKGNHLSVCCAWYSKRTLIALLYFCKRWFHWSWQLHVNGHVCWPVFAKVLIALLYLPHFPQRTDMARAFVSRVIPSR